jgi:hypothetical protein
MIGKPSGETAYVKPGRPGRWAILSFADINSIKRLPLYRIEQRFLQLHGVKIPCGGGLSSSLGVLYIL